MAECDYIEELKMLSSWKDLSALEKICESIESDSSVSSYLLCASVITVKLAYKQTITTFD